MRKAIAALLIGLLSQLTSAAWAQGTGYAPELSPELRAAFDALAQRDPSTHSGIERLLQSDPAAARHHLEQYARYLRERGEAERNDPAKFALLELHERVEGAVQRLAQQMNLAVSEDERSRLTELLRRELDGWFDLRQTLRELDVNRLADQLDAERARQRERSTQRDALRKEWLARVTEGGPQAMRERIEALSAEDVLPAVAPLIVRSVMRDDPQLGEALIALSQSDQATFQEQLRAVIRDRPELVEQARRQAPEDVRLHEALRAAALEAHQQLLPDATRERQPDLADKAVQGVLDRVIDAESDVADANLRQAEAELAAKLAALASRAARKSLIVDIQLSRITGRADEFEW